MCDVLEVASSGYYKWLNNQSEIHPEKEAYKKEVQQKVKKSFHESYGTYGSPRIKDDLDDWGYTISQKTVARIMNGLGLSATPPKRYANTTDSNHNLHIYPNLVNQVFDVEEPDRVWVTDITYIWSLEGWVYLSSVMDLFSRKIIGFSIDSHMKTELTLSSLNKAILSRQPREDLIHHSDRGSQFCANEYINVLNDHGMQISMSRTGNPYDNACIESFHSTIKKDLIHRKRFNTRAEAVKAVINYINNFYNEKRKHSTLGNCSPNNFEIKYRPDTQRLSS